jgi:hypothetical protein
MEKIRIRDKHPGSATLLIIMNKINVPVPVFQIRIHSLDPDTGQDPVFDNQKKTKTYFCAFLDPDPHT